MNSNLGYLAILAAVIVFALGTILAWDGAMGVGAVRCLFGGLALFATGFLVSGYPYGRNP